MLYGAADVMIKNSLILLFTLFLLAGVCVLAYAANPFGSVRIDIPEHTYKIPKNYLNESALFRYFDSMDGLDDSSSSVSLTFPDDEIVAKIPDFQTKVPGRWDYVDENLSIIVHGMDDKNYEYVYSRVHDKELWSGEGRYGDGENAGGRIIKYDEDAKLYRISYAFNESSWAFSKLNPEISTEELAPLNAIVGRCSDKKSSVKPYYNCIHGTVKGNLSITYWISESNFKLYPQIDNFIFAKLDEWEIKDKAQK